MGYFDAIVLGTVQGLTEFLPISSSGHLVIFQHLLRIHSDNIAFEVFVHFGTLLSVLAVYCDDIIRMVSSFFRGILCKNIAVKYQRDPFFRLSIFVIIGTLPAVFVGLLLEDFFVSIFHNINLVGVTLMATGTLILLSHFIKTSQKNLSPGKSLLVGIAQAVAILPGISRSGFTISSALLMGISREDAARFSFLLAIPAILGATLLHLVDLITAGGADLALGPLLLGFLFSFIVGYLAIRILLSILKSGKFVWFAPYCLVIGIIVLVFIS